jgi:hypothetical protein
LPAYSPNLRKLADQLFCGHAYVFINVETSGIAEGFGRVEKPTAEELATIAEGSRAFERGEYVSLKDWIHDVGPGDR